MTTSRAASKGKSTAGPRLRRKRVEHDAEPWTVDDAAPEAAGVPMSSVVYHRWAEPLRPRLNPKIYVAGDDVSRGLQYRACLRRAHAVAGRVPTPTLFADCSRKFGGLEALVRTTTWGSIVILSTLARRAAGDRIEAMKLALAERAVNFIELPEWYLGFEDIVPRSWRTSRRSGTRTPGMSGVD